MSDLSQEELSELMTRRKALYDELYDNSHIGEARKLVNEIWELLEKSDPETYNQLSVAKAKWDYTYSILYDEETGDEAIEIATQERDHAEQVISEKIGSVTGEYSKFWSDWDKARLLVPKLIYEKNCRCDAIMQEISSIEKRLPVKATDPAQVGIATVENGIGSFETYMLENDFNDRLRRIEYHNRGMDFSRLEPHMTYEQAQEVADDPYAEIKAWDDEPSELLMWELEAAKENMDWLNLQLEHYRRIDGQEIDKRDKTLRDNSEKIQKTTNWKPNVQENIRLLQSMQMENHSIEVLFNNYDDHVKRDLCVRYGIDLQSSVRVKFHVSHYSHVNNFYGHLDGHPTKLVLLGLSLTMKNKVHVETPNMNTFRCKTALRPYNEGDRYLELERKYLPLGVGFSKYSRKDLVEAHHKIMAELYPTD